MRVFADRIKSNVVCEYLSFVISGNDVCKGAGSKPETFTTFLELYDEHYKLSNSSIQSWGKETHGNVDRIQLGLEENNERGFRAPSKQR